MTLHERYMLLGHEDETKAAILMAKDLMVGNPATFKRGYAPKNAVLAACEHFPGADRVEVEKEVK